MNFFKFFLEFLMSEAGRDRFFIAILVIFIFIKIYISMSYHFKSFYGVKGEKGMDMLLFTT